MSHPKDLPYGQNGGNNDNSKKVDPDSFRPEFYDELVPHVKPDQEEDGYIDDLLEKFDADIPEISYDQFKRTLEDEN